VKRDASLHALSSDHHHGLVLARTVRRACEKNEVSRELAAQVVEVFERDLDPHFRIEEEALLPVLDQRGEGVLVERTRADHRRLRELRDRIAESADPVALADFARLLEEHIRFEERSLFEVAQAKLSAAELLRVDRR
jgi:hemerythrin-like domain-containing protein